MDVGAIVHIIRGEDDKVGVVDLDRLVSGPVRLRLHQFS